MTNLRNAMVDDAATMAAIHIDAWQMACRGLVPDSFLAALDHEGAAERFRAFLDSGSAETYIVERNGHAIGHLTVGACRDDDLDSRSVAEIWGIHLAPMFWRRGIGTEVCRRAEEMLKARGAGRIVLWAFEGSDRARRFYGAMGYSPNGATKTIEVGAPLRAVRYSKELNSPAASPENAVGPEVEQL
jgi:RimJ/RimL family protein N-acetyltransferase